MVVWRTQADDAGHEVKKEYSFIISRRERKY